MALHRLTQRLKSIVAYLFLVAPVAGYAALPALGINNVSVTAPAAGTTNAVFTVSLSDPGTQVITVRYATANGSAVAGKDYVATNGQLTFNPGETNKTVPVAVYAQAINQPVKTFVVNLTNPANATILASQGTGAILNNVPPPTAAITDSVVTAPSAGTINASFRVSLSGPSGQTVTVNYATADGSAVAGKDYTAVRGTLTFSPGQTFKTVAVTIYSQPAGQPTKSFVLNILSPVNATLFNAQGTGTIINSLALSALSIDSVSVTTPTSGTTNAVFTVSLSPPAGQTVAISYATADGTAVAGTDYVATLGTLTFNFGETSKTIAVVVNAQTVNQPTKSFVLNLSNPVSATIAAGQGVATLLSGVPPPIPAVSLTNVTLTAPTGGTTDAMFTISLSGPSPQPVSIHYTSVDGSAVAGQDYVATSGTLTFSPGQTNQTITVVVNAQTVNQPARSFVVNLDNPVNATILNGQATGTILNAVAPPALSIGGATLTAPIGGTTNAVFTVNLSGPSGYTVTVDYATADGSAVAGRDYLAAGGTLSFAPGETNKTIPVVVNAQTINQPARLFVVNLSNPTNTTVLSSQATATIVNAVAPPTIGINRVTATAPIGGTTNAVFTVSLSGPSGYTVAVSYATMDGSAVAGNDYLAAAGTLTFGPGETNKTIAVVINAQTLNQPARDFTVSLDNPVNATLLIDHGIATILTGVAPPTATINDVTVTAPSTNSTQAVFTVSLSGPSGQLVSLSYSTADGTAMAGSDYVATNGVLSFNSGQTNQAITITILPQTVPKSNDVFVVNLTDATNASLARLQGQGRIASGNRPPVVQIRRPANDATFPPGSDIPVEVLATDPDGGIRPVELYVGTTLLATLTNSPYLFTWSSVNVGDYYLKAIASDTQGAVTVSSTVHVAVTGVTGDVAIVQNAGDPEIGTLQDYLVEMGYSSRVFNPNELTAAAAQGFQLIIWDDVGATPSGLTDSAVTVIYQAFTNGAPLYLIGDNLAAAATNLSDGPRGLWTNLLHLQTSSGTAGSGTITFPDPGSHPVSNGRFGLVNGFSYPLAVQPTTHAVSGGDAGVVLATAGDADVLLAFPSDSSSPDVRSVTQCFRVSNGLDPGSIAARKALFQNAVCWLVRCPLCDLTDMSLDMSAASDTATVGSNLVYTLLIQKFAECEGTGVKVRDVLPSNVQFVTAASPSGTWTYQDGVVLFSLGHFGNGTSANVTITVTPTNAAAITNTATVSANEGDPNPVNNTQTLVTPVSVASLLLNLDILTNGSYQITVAGNGGASCSLEVSTNLTNWLTLTNWAANSTMQFIDTPPADAGRRFYRAELP